MGRFMCLQCVRVNREVEMSGVRPRNKVIKHLLAMLNLPRLKRRPAPDRLRWFVDRLQLHYDVLAELNYHVDRWGDVMTDAVASKLRGPIRQLWDLTARRHKRASRPLVVSLLIDFLWTWCEPPRRPECERYRRRQ